MKKITKILFWIMFIIVISVAILLVSSVLYTGNIWEYIKDISDFSIGLVSLIISSIALIIALITYSSIDSVNEISSMDGNVLCNEHYNVAYYELVRNFEDCETQRQLEEKIFKLMNRIFKKNADTCMKFTDNIQSMIDHLLLFAYFDSKDEYCLGELKKLFVLIDKKYKKLTALSNGDQYVLKEHIKLIKNVVNYQSVSHESNSLDAGGEMLNIRGNMFMNKVTQCIYYDYLGLEYLKKTTALLSKACNLKDGQDLFLPQSIKQIENTALTQEQLNKINIYLNGALDTFYKATEKAGEDLLWNGYISFNKARVVMLDAILNKKTDSTQWKDCFVKAIDDRYKVIVMFCDKEKDFFLKDEFYKEFLYAKSMFYMLKKYYDEISNQEIDDLEEMKRNIFNMNSANKKLFDRIITYLDAISNNQKD